jgi:hypothetical protein
MNWKSYLVAFLILTNAGYMIFDGIHAIVTGDYVTSKSGAYAGQLGPWSKVVEAVGFNPRSNFVKGFFIFQGTVTLALLACYLVRLKWAKTALKIAAVAELWYLPTGTINGVLVLILLSLP